MRKLEVDIWMFIGKEVELLDIPSNRFLSDEKELKNLREIKFMMTFDNSEIVWPILQFTKDEKMGLFDCRNIEWSRIS